MSWYGDAARWVKRKTADVIEDHADEVVGAVGATVGGAVGGTVGLFVGGPAGAAAGVTIGGAAGAGLGDELGEDLGEYVADEIRDTGRRSSSPATEPAPAVSPWEVKVANKVTTWAGRVGDGLAVVQLIERPDGTKKASGTWDGDGAARIVGISGELSAAGRWRGESKPGTRPQAKYSGELGKTGIKISLEVEGRDLSGNLAKQSDGLDFNALRFRFNPTATPGANPNAAGVDQVGGQIGTVASGAEADAGGELVPVGGGELVAQEEEGGLTGFAKKHGAKVGLGAAAISIGYTLWKFIKG